jgi:hypothetical protein
MFPTLGPVKQPSIAEIKDRAERRRLNYTEPPLDEVIIALFEQRRPI